MSAPETLPAVLGYIIAEVTVKVSLPASHPVCKYCVAWLRYERDFDRYTCRVTQELLFDINREVGLQCPLRKEK